MSRTGIAVLLTLLAFIVLGTAAALWVLTRVAYVSVFGLVLFGTADRADPSLASLRTEPAAAARPTDGVLLWTEERDRASGPARLAFAYGTNETDADALAETASRVGSPIARTTQGPSPIRSSALFCRGTVAVYVTISDPTLSDGLSDVRRTAADPKSFRAIATVVLSAADYPPERQVCVPVPGPSSTR